MAKQRRQFSDPDKVAILKRHLVDQIPISELAQELGLYPNQLYDWLKKFFENGHLAFAGARNGKTPVDDKDRKIQQLEEKVETKDRVLVELIQEHTLLKKSLGES